MPASSTHSCNMSNTVSYEGSLNIDSLSALRSPNIAATTGCNGSVNGTPVLLCLCSTILSVFICHHPIGSTSHQRRPLYKLHTTAFLTSEFRQGVFSNSKTSSTSNTSFSL